MTPTHRVMLAHLARIASCLLLAAALLRAAHLQDAGSSHVVNVNHATVAQVAFTLQVPQVVAERIVAGAPYRSLEELQQRNPVMSAAEAREFLHHLSGSLYSAKMSALFRAALEIFGNVDRAHAVADRLFAYRRFFWQLRQYDVRHHGHTDPGDSLNATQFRRRLLAGRVPAVSDENLWKPRVPLVVRTAAEADTSFFRKPWLEFFGVFVAAAGVLIGMRIALDPIFLPAAMLLSGFGLLLLERLLDPLTDAPAWLATAVLGGIAPGVVLFTAMQWRASLEGKQPGPRSVWVLVGLILAATGPVVARIPGWSLGGYALMLVGLAAVGAGLPPASRLDRWMGALAVTGIACAVLAAFTGVSAHLGSLQFQPVEVARALLVVWGACYLAAEACLMRVHTRWRELGPLLGMLTVAVCMVFLAHDLGPLFLIFFAFALTMAAVLWKWLYALLGVVAVVGGGMAWSRISEHIGETKTSERVAMYLNPWTNHLSNGFQTGRGLWTLAQAGLWGAGPGRGLLDRIPAVDTDLSLVALGHDFGVVGVAAALVAVAAILWRAAGLSVTASQTLERSLALAIAILLALQTVVITYGVLDWMPLTGITFPLVSRGATSTSMIFWMLGLLGQISQSISGRSNPS